MTKPATIRRFELAYFAWIALTLVDIFLQYDGYVAQVNAQSAGSGVALGSSFVTVLFVVWILFMLLLWFLVARKRSVVAKWIIVLLTIVNVFGVPMNNLLSAPAIVAVLTLVASLVASWSLFGAEANLWFSAPPAAETAPLE